jgi:hypothetical protein
MKQGHWHWAAIAAVSTFAISTAAVANHAWSTYHWKKTGAEATPPVVTALSGLWPSHANIAIQDWNQSNVIQSPGPTLASGTNPKTCKAQAGKILVCNERYGRNGWLGIASIWLSGGHISQGTTKLNDSYFGSSPYNTNDWRQLVACQEIGHDYGLGHQDEDFSTDDTNSCMDYTSLPAGNTHPDNHDYQQLQDIYDHTESSFTMLAPGQKGGSSGVDTSLAGQKAATAHRPGAALSTMTDRADRTISFRNLAAGRRRSPTSYGRSARGQKAGIATISRANVLANETAASAAVSRQASLQCAEVIAGHDTCLCELAIVKALETET